MPPEGNGFANWLLSTMGVKPQDVVDANNAPATNEQPEEKEMAEEKDKFTSEDAANYGTALGNVLTGTSAIIASIKGEKQTTNTNTVATRANEKATEGSGKGGSASDDKTGYAWYVWAGAIVVAALVGWGIYALAIKKS